MKETPPARDDRLRLPALLEYRIQAERRRAAAFADAPTWILGCLVKPITPHTWSMLTAMRSPLLTGGRVEAWHVLDFIWIHSPLFRDTSRPFWRLAKWWALRRARFELLQPWRKLIGRRLDLHRHLATLAIAISEIKEELENAWADGPPKSKRALKPIASLEAFFIHEFLFHYGQPAEVTRHQPLRHLVQLHKVLRVARGDANEDEGENRILEKYLREKNAAQLAKLAGKEPVSS